MVESEVIAGLGTPDSWVRAAPDLMQRVSSADERALAAAIGPAARLREVVERCGLPEAKAIATLLGMRLRGLVQPARAPTGEVAPVPAAPARATAEGVDLDEGRQREILELEARLSTDDLFSLLGVAPGACAAECKKAYYELTKRFHPDRYFGKRLGSFKPRIEAVFRTLTEAQATLCDPARRAAYLDEHPHLAESASPAGGPPVDPRLAAQRAAERRSRFARHPYLARQGKLHELIARGREAMAKGDFARAATDLAQASEIDPKNPEVAELVAKTKKATDKLKVQQEIKAADEAELAGDSFAAISHLRSAVALDPGSAEVTFRAGQALSARGGDSELKEAHVLLRKAAELAPAKVEYRLAFARHLQRIGLEKNAQRELEAVLKLEPGNATAKELLRKIRWRF